MNLRTKKSLTVNTKIPRYPNDGNGRDTYITYSILKNSDYFPPGPPSSVPPVHKSQDLSLSKPIKRYHMDGKGRDYYVQYTINENTNKYSGDVNIQNCLRNSTTLPNEINVPKGYSNFERRLINRIFYGKCDGLKTRYMSPKVFFAKKKKDLEEDEKLREEEEERLRQEEEERLFKEKQEEEEEKKKRNPYANDPPLTQEKLSESVRKIFLFNNNFLCPNKKVNISWH
jgi:hypothetical protein